MVDQNKKIQLRQNQTYFPKQMIFGPIVYTLEDVKHGQVFEHVVHTSENEKLVRFLDMQLIYLKM